MPEYPDHTRIAQTLLDQQSQINTLTAEHARAVQRAEQAEAELAELRKRFTDQGVAGTDLAVQLGAAEDALKRVSQRCQAVRDREGPSGMINASQILGLLSPTWPDGNHEAPAALDEPKEH